ncbi:MAG: protein-glutamate O-methyltransferase CheR [Bacillota bacterium]|nr:protein-glutamate O-methyltransferase CheR [Bacillota bacterium]
MNSWEWFIGQFEPMSKIDLTAYKRPQMERRINSFMRSAGAEDYQQFLNIIRTDKRIYRKFIEHLTINVSEFFRNQSHWDVLEREIVPSLLKERKALKVWSAGCSTGEEPYSLAMMFQEKFQSRVEKIIASDLDDEVLDKAGIGLYGEKAFETVPSLYQKKYFTREGDFYKIADGVKKTVHFQRHDLLMDRYPSGLDLILCRNVVIYFTEETKQKLYRKFADALRSGGVIFIGSTEQIFQAKEVGLQSTTTFFYRKF